MRIPEKVKVAGYLYAIDWSDESFILNGDSVCDGGHLFAEQKIKVAKNGNTAYQNTVFLHELCHAIVASYCTDTTYDEEKFVEQFSKGLYQVVTDNPDIFR